MPPCYNTSIRRAPEVSFGGKRGKWGPPWGEVDEVFFWLGASSPTYIPYGRNFPTLTALYNFGVSQNSAIIEFGGSAGRNLQEYADNVA